MEVEDRFLLLGARKTLETKELVVFEELLLLINNWDSILNQALKHHIGGLLYKNLLKIKSKSIIPENVLLKLKKEYLSTLATNCKINHDFKILNQVLIDQNIYVIPLKGMVLKEIVYKDLGLRKIADVDILVQKKDLEIVKNTMLLNDWVVNDVFYKNETHEFVHKLIAHHPYVLRKNNLTVELHLGIHRNNHDKYNVEINDFWVRAKKNFFLDSNILLLNQTDLIIHLCIHTKGDFFNNKIKLKSFIDIAEILSNKAEEIDVELLWSSAIRYNCHTELEQLFLLCHKFLNVKFNSTLEKKMQGLKIQKNYELLFLNLFNKSLKGRLYFIYLNYERKRKLRKLIKGFPAIFKYWIGFIFPSKLFVLDRFKNRNKSKIHYKLYRLIKVIK